MVTSAKIALGSPRKIVKNSKIFRTFAFGMAHRVMTDIFEKRFCFILDSKIANFY